MTELFTWLFSGLRKEIRYFPLEVIAENANTKAVFSETVCLAVKPHVIETAQDALDDIVVFIPDVDVYTKTFELLERLGRDSDSKDLTPDVIEAVNTYKEYLDTFNEEHKECLKKLDDTDGELSETEVLSVYAVHVFEPLLMKSQLWLNDKACNSNVCPFCRKLKDSILVKSTEFGPTSLWHGRADMIIIHKNTCIQQIVSTATCIDDDSDTDSFGCCKDESRDHADSCGDEGVDSEEMEFSQAGIDKSVFRGKLFSFGEEETKTVTSRMLSQMIVNAFLISGRCCDLEDYFIPSFLASRQGVLVTLYNTSNDILLSQDKPMRLFSAKGNMQQVTFFTVWLMLNFKKFPDDSVKNYKELELQSGFKKCLKALSLKLYRDPVHKKQAKEEPKCVSAKELLKGSGFKRPKVLNV